MAQQKKPNPISRRPEQLLVPWCERKRTSPTYSSPTAEKGRKTATGLPRQRRCSNAYAYHKAIARAVAGWAKSRSHSRRLPSRKGSRRPRRTARTALRTELAAEYTQPRSDEVEVPPSRNTRSSGPKATSTGSSARAGTHHESRDGGSCTWPGISNVDRKHGTAKTRAAVRAGFGPATGRTI